MPYTLNQKRLIAAGICIQCELNEVKKFRRCQKCRAKAAKVKPSRKAYFKNRYKERKAARLAGRGYWPE